MLEVIDALIVELDLSPERDDIENEIDVAYVLTSDGSIIFPVKIA